MDQSLIIRDDCIARVDSQAGAVPLGQYAQTLVRFAERGESDQPIPPGVRFLIHRLPATLLVLEEPPQVRTVQWLDDNSRERFGAAAVYRQVRLAFPYIVIVVVFMQGILTTRTQCFYRTAPLGGRNDQLFIPNLYNVDNREDMPCWLCLRKLEEINKVQSWGEKVEALRRHFWGAAFNCSATLLRQKSYWWKMKLLDPRISELDRWQAASTQHPLFPLEVRWTPLRQTLGGIMDLMLDKIVTPYRFTITEDWLSLMPPIEAQPEEEAAP
ncbi:MAG: hypothetical protein MRJ68_11825 [Nitrospira sp.]|nr:hypothetical protein [Nitrospira sp.]